MSKKYQELNKIQEDYIDLLIRYLNHLKTSNDYTSPSLSSDLTDELNSLFDFEKENTIRQTIKSFNNIRHQLEKLK